MLNCSSGRICRYIRCLSTIWGSSWKPNTCCSLALEAGFSACGSFLLEWGYVHDTNVLDELLIYFVLVMTCITIARSQTGFARSKYHQPNSISQLQSYFPFRSHLSVPGTRSRYSMNARLVPWLNISAAPFSIPFFLHAPTNEDRAPFACTAYIIARIRPPRSSDANHIRFSGTALSLLSEPSSLVIESLSAMEMIFRGSEVGFSAWGSEWELVWRLGQ